jgi:hypothetical protein
MNGSTGAAVRAGALLALIACGLTAAPARAQLTDLRAATGLRLEAYSFAEPERVDLDRVVLLTLPIGVTAPLTRGLALGVRGAFARAELTRADGRALTLSGLTDTELSLTTAVADDRVRLRLLALLPTGQTGLTPDELDVAGVIAADLLPFAISNWGSRGGIGASAAVAVPLGYQMAAGLSAGYVVAREFEPLADATLAYRPGNQLHARAAVDRTVGSAGKASLQVIYQHFGTDRSGGYNLFEAGDRLQAVASYAFAAGARGNGVTYAGYLRRQRGRYSEFARLTPAQDLIYAGAGFRYPAGGMVLLPALDVRLVGTADGLDQGYVLTAGSGAELTLGRLELVPTARARLGRLTLRKGQESGLTGLELGATIRNAGRGR